MKCPYCDGYMDYTGIDDGFGDNGQSVCETWHCVSCEIDVIGACFDPEQCEDTESESVE